MGPKSKGGPRVSFKNPPPVSPRQPFPDSTFSHIFRKKRATGSRGPPGWALWGGVIALTINGFYWIAKANNRNANFVRETRELQMAIYPYRKAESDHMLLGELNARSQYEADVMKNIEGWVPGESVFKYRWVRPNTHLHEDVDSAEL